MELIDNIKICIKNYIKNSNLKVETDTSTEICNGESYYCPTTRTLKIPVIDATFHKEIQVQIVYLNYQQFFMNVFTQQEKL